MGKKKAGRKAGVNKAKAIREYCAANPNDGPAKVAESLNASKGWKITPQYVSTIKSSAKRKKITKKKTRAAGRSAGETGDKISISKLMQAKKLADQLGGVDKAKHALDALAKIVG